MLLGLAHIQEKPLACTFSWEGKRHSLYPSEKNIRAELQFNQVDFTYIGKI